MLLFGRVINNLCIDYRIPYPTICTISFDALRRFSVGDCVVVVATAAVNTPVFAVLYDLFFGVLCMLFL